MDLEENLTKNQLALCEWKIESEDINFDEFELEIARYKAVIETRKEIPADPTTFSHTILDLLSYENESCILDDKGHANPNDKQKVIHPIARWYGLRDFVVLSSKKKAILDVSHIKLLQSAISLAVFESKCEVPIFLQVKYKEQEVFLGFYEHSEFRLSFDIIHLRNTPSTCKYLSGLLDLFKGKIGVQYLTPTMVSVCMTYSLKNFLTATFAVEKYFEFSGDSENSNNKYLPFGVSVDPVNELILYAKWEQVAENVVFDSQTYSDFNPINAPKWSIRTRYDYQPVCFLADFVSEFLILSECREAISEYYNFIGNKHRVNEQNPLAKLTETPRLGFMGGRSQSSDSIDGPLNEAQLSQMFAYLFPDEDELHKYPYDVKGNESVSTFIFTIVLF